MTRAILAEEPPSGIPAGVFKVDVIAAYNSAAQFSRDFHLGPTNDHLAQQALLLSRRLAVPNLPDADEAFAEAVRLSRSDRFREHRRALFEWQETAVVRGYTPEQAVAHVSELADRYNDAVERAFRVVRWKFLGTLGTAVFSMGAAALSLAANEPYASAAAVLSAGSATLSLVQFAMADNIPAIEAGAAAVAAMFHDAEQYAGVVLNR